MGSTFQEYRRVYEMLEDGEVLIDAGRRALNSILRMRGYCERLKKVYALEPDSKYYAVCQERRARSHRGHGMRVKRVTHAI